MAQSVTQFDTDITLWKKVAINWYDYAINEGVTGLTPPNWNEDKWSLLKKAVYYTARIAENSP